MYFVMLIRFHTYLKANRSVSWKNSCLRKRKGPWKRFSRDLHHHNNFCLSTFLEKLICNNKSMRRIRSFRRQNLSNLFGWWLMSNSVHEWTIFPSVFSIPGISIRGVFRFNQIHRLSVWPADRLSGNQAVIRRPGRYPAGCPYRFISWGLSKSTARGRFKNAPSSSAPIDLSWKFCFVLARPFCRVKGTAGEREHVFASEELEKKD